MTVWQRIREYLSEMAQALSPFDNMRNAPENSVAFTISIISLAAKMAKADGRVTIDEVRSLRQIFEFNEQDEKDIARVFDLARQDSSGFQSYAQRIAKLFSANPEMLEDIFESLFVIALSDGFFHENEELFLDEVRKIFNLSETYFNRLKQVYTDQDFNPYEVLGVPQNSSPEKIRDAYKKIIKECHPDQLRANGLPSEAIALAEQRIRAANQAYEALGKS